MDWTGLAGSEKVHVSEVPSDDAEVEGVASVPRLPEDFQVFFWFLAGDGFEVRGALEEAEDGGIF